MLPPLAYNKQEIEILKDLMKKKLKNFNLSLRLNAPNNVKRLDLLEHTFRPVTPIA